ncbi:putative ribonuclease H-like domain-containing protein [Tanacetum coccineum]|uniref:Ribonuclease H-like domain-containing protein n=1 Tax=Tanacetum coccineum TaxID=301880 RepID=A0ABQ4XXX0_9ASTR
MTHPHPKRNFVPRAVLMKSDLKTLNTTRQNSSRAVVSVNTARPINTAYPRPTVNSEKTVSNVFNRAHLHVRKPFNKYTTNKNINFNEKVNTVRENVTTVGPKAVVNDNKGNEANAVKASAYWVWRPKHKVLVLDYGNPQLELQEKGVIDNGCSRHMSGNKSYLLDYEEIDGGFVAFGGNSKGGKITRKDFKLTDESHVLLKVPRKDNMYSVDLRNVIPQGATKDETSGILKAFITGIENQINHRVKIIRCDNGTEFKNKEMNQFCEMKGIKREFSIARTLQQNGVAERKNRTPIEAARTMLADSKLPNTFWAKAVNTACYVQNKILVIKPHNKTPYELFHGRTPSLSFMRPFGCPVTILNTLDHLGKFDGKADEGFFVGYSVNNKAFRVFNSRTRIVEKTLQITFLENKPNVAGSGPEWPFDINTLTKSMNYKPVVAGNQSNGNVGTKSCDDAGIRKARFPSPTVNAASIKDSAVDENIVYGCADDLNMPNLEEIVYSDDDEDVGAEANMTNLDTHIPISRIPTTRIHKDHLVEQIIRDIHSAPQTRKMTKRVTDHVEPKKVIQALTDPSWIEAMHDELIQFKLQNVWILVDLPYGKRAIGTKWVDRNKKDERGIVVRNKARMAAQGYTQEEGIYYDEVFAPVARIEAIKLFLAYASFMNFGVYQMNVKSTFLYGKIEEEVYVCQPLGFEHPEFPDRVYKVENTLYGLHQALRAWVKGDILLVQVYVDDIIFGSTKKELCTEFEKLMHKKFQISSMVELTFFLGLQVKQKEDGIFISQNKYVDEILKKFGFSTVKTTSTPMETSKPLMKDENAEDVDVHLYRSMIGSLMYLTSLRPDIMLAVCACARFQVTPKVSHLYAVKRIIRYLKDRKSTTGGCQFRGSRLISWQCKKQTVVANSTTEAEFVAGANCYGQVLWIQNQMLDYGYNFMNNKIFIDNESTIYIVKNPVFHLKTKHIEIRHHFIRDSKEKKVIQMIKIHTD